MTNDKEPKMPKAEQTTSNANPNTTNTSNANAAFNPFAAFASFDPMQAWTQGQQAFAQGAQAWQKMWADGAGRAQAWQDEYAAYEAELFKRANAAVDTWAQLAHDSIAYSQQLAQQARKLTVEAARKAGASVGVGA